MKRIFLPIGLGALLLAARLGATDAAPRVTVAFFEPEKFTDVRDSALFNDSGRTTYLEQIRDHLLAEAPQ